MESRLIPGGWLATVKWSYRVEGTSYESDGLLMDTQILPSGEDGDTGEILEAYMGLIPMGATVQLVSVPLNC